MTEGLVPDVMHDILEGCLAYEVEELLKHIVNTRLISLSELDNIIQSFPYLGLDRQNKPSPILYPHLITASGKLVGLHVHTYSTLICCTSNQVINTLYTCLVINLPVHTYTIAYSYFYTVVFSHTDVVSWKAASIDDR